jgi:hypothetical protein
MSFISVTRIRIRSIQFLPQFAIELMRTQRQIKRAQGLKSGSLLADRAWAFWTVTAWDSEESMRQYMMSGAHRNAMPKLVEWCDEASAVHWEQSDTVLPSWAEADRRMRESGRPSKVRHPSPRHQTLSYRDPRTTLVGSIRPQS